MKSTTEKLTEAIDALMPEGDFVPAVLAARLMEQLMREQPKLLKEWMYEHTLRFLTAHIQKLLVDRRAVAVRRVTKPEAFERAADAASNGDTEKLGMFAIRFVVDTKNTRRELGQMTGKDHEFVAGGYSASANRAAMKAAFHTALAKKVGDKRTEEVMDVEECERLYESIVTSTKKKPVRAA